MLKIKKKQQYIYKPMQQKLSLIQWTSSFNYLLFCFFFRYKAHIIYFEMKALADSPLFWAKNLAVSSDP